MSKKSEKIAVVGYRNPETNESFAIKPNDQGGVTITAKSTETNSVVSINLSRDAALAAAHAIHRIVM